MKLCTWILAALLIAGCIHVPTAADRTQRALAMAKQAGWHQQIIATDRFDLAAFTPQHPVKTDTLIVYIEGDGLAWISRSTPSTDPTPVHPLALQLALREPEAAVYLAHPCQYAKDAQKRNCSAKYWAGYRFAPEVIHAENEAVDKLKQQSGASRLVLVGYSGGGGTAALIAAKRKDVVYLVTIAGNLDTAAWANLHRISPLTGSLNPADFWQALQYIPQTHYVGEQDRTVPPAVARSYAARFPPEHQPVIVVLPGFDHHCCWANAWHGVSKPPHP
ncbi:MAG: hypothetical protein Q9M27_01740 [Mariprofundaceae bacterium]|nr:hypothetical protein [Mariprofundaceae bacterium]